MFCGTMDVTAPLPTDQFATLRTWSHRALAFTQSERFGNAVIILFFLAQALDGALTYVGVSLLGRDVEGNPLLHWLMGAAGQGAALALAKLAAAGFGCDPAAGTFRVVFLPRPEELSRIYDDIADFTGRYLASA